MKYQAVTTPAASTAATAHTVRQLPNRDTHTHTHNTARETTPRDEHPVYPSGSFGFGGVGERDGAAIRHSLACACRSMATHGPTGGTSQPRFVGTTTKSPPTPTLRLGMTRKAFRIAIGLGPASNQLSPGAIERVMRETVDSPPGPIRFERCDSAAKALSNAIDRDNEGSPPVSAVKWSSPCATSSPTRSTRRVEAINRRDREPCKLRASHGCDAAGLLLKRIDTLARELDEQEKERLKNAREKEHRRMIAHAKFVMASRRRLAMEGSVGRRSSLQTGLKALDTSPTLPDGRCRRASAPDLVDLTLARSSLELPPVPRYRDESALPRRPTRI